MPAKLTIENAHNLAESRGFRFLSTEFNNIRTKYSWQCSKGHEWQSGYSNIKQGTGCPDCSIKSRRELNIASGRYKTIKDAHCLAESRGIKFLSKEFNGTREKYDWGCGQGHKWTVQYAKIQQGHGCPNCKNSVQKTIKVAHKLANAKKLAESKGFKFLSNEFKMAKDYYKWQCSKGHIWNTTYACIQQGSGCPKCRWTKKKWSIEDCQNIAQLKNGKCLSTNYQDARTKLTWECSMGHIWNATHNTIKGGHWCPNCSGRNQKIEDCHKFAHTKNGKFLSTDFSFASSKYKWECSKGHIFDACFSSVKLGSWCGVCAGNKRKSIEDCHKIADLKNGKCLSKEYKTAHDHYQWECCKGHVWEATYNEIQQGRWCKKCGNFNFAETITRYCFDKIFGCEFKKSHPNWLVNPKTLKKLELDGFNEKLQIAFEHQGIHHEVDCPRKSMLYHSNQFEKDNIKREKCKEYGITLIEVPEVGRRLKINEVIPFLLSEFDKHNIAYPESAKNFQIDMKEFYVEYMNKSIYEYQPIDQFDLNNNFIKTWDNPMMAVNFLCKNGFKSISNLRKCLKGERKVYLGFKWKYSLNEKSTTGVDDFLSELDAMDFSDDSLFVDSIMDEVNDLDFDDPALFN
jgi:hypothetical protein